MATEYVGDTITVAAGEDLRAYQYHIVAVSDGDRAVTADGLALCGVLLNTPDSGQAATLQVARGTKAKAGGTLTAGARVSITASGTLQAATSAHLYSIGFAIEAVASGGLAPVFLDRGAGGA